MRTPLLRDWRHEVARAPLEKPRLGLASDVVARHGRSYDRRMTQHVSVSFLPMTFEPRSLDGGLAIVLDILRASTTIVQALASGAARVIPCETVDEAREKASQSTAASRVLGGERSGIRIEGFHFGNSPLEYTAAAIAGRTLFFTTTNGTRALARCRFASRVLIGALVNLRSIVDAAVADGRSVQIVCAGTDGKVSAEDVLCAGAIADGIARTQSQGVQLGDAARISRSFWQNWSTPALVRQVLRESHGGVNLIGLGYDADVDRCAEIDRFDLVPEFQPSTGTIEALRAS